MRTKNPNIIKVSLVFVMFLILTLASPYIFNMYVSADAQETCPHTGDWVKVDGISAQSYNYSAPEGKLVVEVCYKAGTTVNYYNVDPGQPSVTVTTSVPNPNDNAFQDISHASFRLADKPQEPKEGDISLSGECLNNGYIQWTVSNTYGESIGFNWSANNNESGSESVPANGSKTFTTSVSGNEVTITFTADNEEKQLSKSVSACEEPKSGDVSLSGLCLNNGYLEWTVFNTTDSVVQFSWSTANSESGSGQVAASSTTTFKTTENGNNLTLVFSLDNQENELSESVSVCSQPSSPNPEPDVAAGGMGPSLVTSLAPFVTGFFGLGAASILTVKSKKVTK